MSFKERVADDNLRTFLNVEEFAEKHTIKYDGETYPDVPIVFNNIKQKDRPTLVGNADHLAGLHIATGTAYIAMDDLNGVKPEQGRDIRISDGYAANATFFQRLRIVTSAVDMGVIRLELEAYDE